MEIQIIKRESTGAGMKQLLAANFVTLLYALPVDYMKMFLHYYHLWPECTTCNQVFIVKHILTESTTLSFKTQIVVICTGS